MMIEKKVRPVITYEKKEIDKNLFRRKSNAKTFKGLLIGDMKKARDEKNWEMVEVIQHYYKKYLSYETSEKLMLESWKGKDNLELIEEPDRIIVVWHKKNDKGEKAKEHRDEIDKSEINKVIIAINKLDEGEKISTPDIAEETYKTSWDKIFCSRKLHITYTHILNILEMKNIIHYYRSGLIKVLKKIKTLEELK